MDIFLINQKLLDEISLKASENSRLRMNHNIHNHLEDPVNRMLNALEPGTYLRPHRHWTPPKTESYIVLRGELDVLVFDDTGNLIQKMTLNPEIGNYDIDIPAGIWHSMIIKQSSTVIYEVKEGPFTPITAEDFAPWAPEPGNVEDIEVFFKRYS